MVKFPQLELFPVNRCADCQTAKFRPYNKRVHALFELSKTHQQQFPYYFCLVREMLVLSRALCVGSSKVPTTQKPQKPVSFCNLKNCEND